MSVSTTVSRPPAPLSINVFCGARSGPPEMVEAAKEVGRKIGARGHGLIYGGGGSGLMGEVSWAAHHAGAAITGVIPQFLYELERGIATPPQIRYMATTMAERKTTMFRFSDAFLALPGGYGTLDEVVEVLSLLQLGRTTKPLVLLDVAGFWRSLRRLISDMQSHTYIDPSGHELFQVATSADEAFDVLETLASPATAMAIP